MALAKAEIQTSEDLMLTEYATDANNVSMNVRNTENEKGTRIGGGAADKKTITDQKKDKYHTFNNSVLETDNHGTRNPECTTHVTWVDVVKSGRNSNE